MTIFKTTLLSAILLVLITISLDLRKVVYGEVAISVVVVPKS